MDRNSIIGFILIGVIFFGFTWYQSDRYRKQREYQAQLDSAAMVEQMFRIAQDSIAAVKAGASGTSGNEAAAAAGKYRDSLLNSRYNGAQQFVTLSNGKLELVFTTKGAQPYTARLNDYRAYDSTDLYLIKAGYSDYNIALFAG